MPSPSPGRSLLRCESLESRDTPSSPPVVADSFDTITTPWLPPADWQTWASNGQAYYGVGRTALSGTQSMAVFGTVGVTSLDWSTTPVPADAAVAAAVPGPVPAPVFGFARGQNLGTAAPTYLAAALTPAGAIELHDVRGGADRVVQRVAAPATPGGWLRVTLTAQGATASVTVQRADTGQYLTPAGQ